MMKKFGRMVDFEAVQAHTVNIRVEELEVEIMEKEYMQSQELKEWEVRSRKRKKSYVLRWSVMALFPWDWRVTLKYFVNFFFLIRH